MCGVVHSENAVFMQVSDCLGSCLQRRNKLPNAQEISYYFIKSLAHVISGINYIFRYLKKEIIFIDLGILESIKNKVRKEWQRPTWVS